MTEDEQRQKELGSLLRDLRVTLAAEADLVTVAQAAAREGTLGALAETAEELLRSHGDFAVKYRQILGRWLRPGHPTAVRGGAVALSKPPPKVGPLR